MINIIIKRWVRLTSVLTVLVKNLVKEVKESFYEKKKKQLMS